MKILIDIPEMLKNTIDIPEARLDMEDLVIMADSIHNGTPIRDNATNGDVIKAMFPNSKYTEYFADVEMRTVESDTRFKSVFDRDWWDEPYQKGGKE